MKMSLPQRYFFPFIFPEILSLVTLSQQHSKCRNDIVSNDTISEQLHLTKKRGEKFKPLNFPNVPGVSQHHSSGSKVMTRETRVHLSLTQRTCMRPTEAFRAYRYVQVAV